LTPSPALAYDGFLGWAVVAGRCHGTPIRRRGGGVRIRAEWERFAPEAVTGVSYLEEVDPPPGIGLKP